MISHLSPAKAVSLAVVALALAGCAGLKVTHVPPGQSVDVALAKKADLVRLPTTASDPGVVGPASSVEPALPAQSSAFERGAEAYSRGQFCMAAGKDDEATAAFEEAVKIDPAFTEAWQQLAMLYEKKGDSKKALDAFRRAKKVAQQ